MLAYFASLDPGALFVTFPGGIAQGMIWGVMALGVFLTFKMLNFADLTVDGSFATGGAVAVMVIFACQNSKSGFLQAVGPELGLVLAFFAGVLCGLVTGFLHTLLGIPDILAGILTQISLYSINLHIMGKANQAINPNEVKLRITSNIQHIYWTILFVVIIDAVIVCLLYWYLGTEQGSAIRATGINPNMSRAQGINTGNMKVITLALSNGMVAMAGGMICQFQGFADVNMGRGAIVVGLAAVIIGEVLGLAILGKHMNFMLRLTFVVIGGILYYLVYNFVIWLKFPANDMKLLTAIVVAIFLAVPYLQDKRKSSFRSLAKKNKTANREGGKAC
ncbi:MAG: ABC transporter permease [Lachnospiraceae bacterium]|jgi:putative ABC transport system permease protein|nr:ABC transporter permease [Lachnospiraceae bacterium]